MGPAFELDPAAERQAVGAKRAARGVAAGLEIGCVDCVERRPFLHVGQHHRAFDQRVIAKPAALQNRTELGRYTFGYKVYTPVYYGYYVHEGTAPHVMSKFPGSYRFPGTNAYFGQMVFTEVVRHPGNSAQPFLQDALIAMA